MSSHQRSRSIGPTRTSHRGASTRGSAAPHAARPHDAAWERRASSGARSMPRRGRYAAALTPISWMQCAAAPRSGYSSRCEPALSVSRRHCAFGGASAPPPAPWADFATCRSAASGRCSGRTGLTSCIRGVGRFWAGETKWTDIDARPSRPSTPRLRQNWLQLPLRALREQRTLVTYEARTKATDAIAQRALPSLLAFRVTAGWRRYASMLATIERAATAPRQ